MIKMDSKAQLTVDVISKFAEVNSAVPKIAIGKLSRLPELQSPETSAAATVIHPQVPLVLHC